MPPVEILPASFSSTKGRFRKKQTAAPILKAPAGMCLLP